MEVEGSSLGTISSLPHDITSKILSLMPIKDALRTSILSKKWRYRWASIPVLEFDDTMFKGSSQHKEVVKYKFANAIYHVLMLHSGPLVEFSLFCEVDMSSEIDHIIMYLSRSNTLNRLNFINRSRNNYKLPSSFFSLQGLEHLDIINFHFDPPLTFNGFSRLKWLIFCNVKITTEMLKRFLTNCPLLEVFYLFGEHEDFTIDKKITFVELFECLPSKIETLGISRFYFEYFAAGGMPLKLPNPLIHLKFLVLGVCLMKQDELFSTICLINNSPNLQKLALLLDLDLDSEPTSIDVADLQDYSNLKLDHLQEFEMVGFSNIPIELEFMKLVMAKSHVLKKVLIKLSDNVSVDEEVRMLRDLIQLPFPRASPSAMLLVERPNTSS